MKVAVMVGQSELMLQKELAALKKYAKAKGFEIIELEPLVFVARNLPARDGEKYSLHVKCDDYPVLPPILRWCSPDEPYDIEKSQDIPKGSGGFFHGSGTPCAPWNRASYKQFRGSAPHGDWDMQAWQANEKTGECKTIPRMILKMCAKLQSNEYTGRGK